MIPGLQSRRPRFCKTLKTCQLLRNASWSVYGKSIWGIALVVILVFDVAFIFKDEDERKDWNSRACS